MKCSFMTTSEHINNPINLYKLIFKIKVVKTNNGKNIEYLYQ